MFDTFKGSGINLDMFKLEYKIFDIVKINFNFVMLYNHPPCKNTRPHKINMNK